MKSIINALKKEGKQLRTFFFLLLRVGSRTFRARVMPPPATPGEDGEISSCRKVLMHS